MIEKTTPEIAKDAPINIEDTIRGNLISIIIFCISCTLSIVPIPILYKKKFIISETESSYCPKDKEKQQ